MPAARTLSTAEERREEILQAAERVFAARGLHGTPTMEIAKAAGISQAYLFRLFPTKAELFMALVERCNARVLRTF
ncbi:MAG: TetR/AcrR family transcriptional regulator, partial [Actinomycetota bacterium]|nr:TetR/AcrR family transcriptional regulator [Actinomycetota bacterium]